METQKLTFFGRALRKTNHLYYKFRYLWPVWYWVLNRKARVRFKKNKRELGDLEKRVSEDLKNNGIATLHISELLGEDIFPALKDLAEAKWNSPEVQNNILPERERALKSGEIGREKFFWVWLGGMPGDAPPQVLNFEDPFIKLSLDEKILQVVSSYLGLSPKFLSYGLQSTLVMPPGSIPKLSQRWHRDPDDKKMCKVFLYLTDVLDEGAGPFMYVAGSHYGGKWRNIFPQIPPVGSYPKDGEVEKIIRKDDVKICLGRAGTLIFCDTSGLHKGGFSTLTRRIMFTADFTSLAHTSTQERRYLKPNPEDTKNLSELAKFATTN